MNENLKDLFARLSAPFHPDDIEWRVGATNAEKTKALALAYITSRAVMDRLDDVIGPQNWRDEYAPGPDGGVICGLSLRIHDEWITKWDGADNTDIEAIKGGLSDAFKRAGYKWGIGRYLYRLPAEWVSCEAHGKSVTLKATPRLPAWALPDEWRPISDGASSGAVVSKPAAAPAKPFSEREAQLLAELGFGQKPVPEPAPLQAAPVTPGPSASGGNGGSALPKPKPPQNGKRSLSWGMGQVEALLKSKLAANPVEAVRMLNESSLPQDASPEQVLAYFQK